MLRLMPKPAYLSGWRRLKGMKHCLISSPRSGTLAVSSNHSSVAPSLLVAPTFTVPEAVNFSALSDIQIRAFRSWSLSTPFTVFTSSLTTTSNVTSAFFKGLPLASVAAAIQAWACVIRSPTSTSSEPKVMNSSSSSRVAHFMSSAISINRLEDLRIIPSCVFRDFFASFSINRSDSPYPPIKGILSSEQHMPTPRFIITLAQGTGMLSSR
mmetsp:Transcript_93378/g.250059  ORF Transcript_93378/g.250059 Transcript_93378/m.250059 type:complete len:211 (-) Transcript_93378:873-1505(-)